jgi:hypothetical protein
LKIGKTILELVNVLFLLLAEEASEVFPPSSLRHHLLKHQEP